jgi:SAM-dependent methyltransferase
VVLELGCGSGPLTAELIGAGYRVIATDASAAMVDLTAERVGDGAEDIRQLTLPVDPLPDADAIVAIGHPLNYLHTAEEIDVALIAMAAALRPAGRLAFDVCDLEWGRVRQDQPPLGRADEDWAIVTQFTTPAPDRFVRDITTFLPNDDGSWRRSQEHHETVLIDTGRLPALFDAHGVDAAVGSSFGTEQLPDGLKVITGQRRA